MAFSINLVIYQVVKHACRHSITNSLNEHLMVARSPRIGGRVQALGISIVSRTTTSLRFTGILNSRVFNKTRFSLEINGMKKFEG